MDELLFSEFDQALGEENRERLRIAFENYQYYEGRQHRNENGELVDATELEQPPDLDYMPTRYATNYFKAIINKKARWQMGGKHNVVVPRKQIDDPVEALQPQYEPSNEQQRSDELAEGYEKLLKQLWFENKMRTRLLQAARDRMIADRVVCKIVYNQNTGKLRWLFRPDTEYFPVYSDDDFEELIACHFIRQMFVEVDGEEEEAIKKQTFRLEGEGESRHCTLEEAVYLVDDLESPLEVTQPKMTMELDFIPVVEIPVNDLLAETDAQSEVADLREQNDVLNQMNEDAIDSLKFEMFSMTALKNVPEGTSQSIRIAPGSVLELSGGLDGNSPDVDKVESGFRWNTAFKEQYTRVKAAMHEVSGLPHVVPQELNFGGLNGDALQVLFHDIISDTEEHWLTWEYALKEIHEKSVRYLQARLGEPNFAYDKDIVRAIEDYDTEIKFALPLPDNRKELVELVTLEMSSQLESQTGGMQRLGVEDIKAKKEEIRLEQQQRMQATNPYGEEGASPVGGVTAGVQALTTGEDGKLRDPESGEEVEICPVCEGSGQEIDPSTGEYRTCQNCRGDGYVQVRKR